MKWARRKRRRLATEVPLRREATIEVIFQKLADYFAGNLIDAEGNPAKPDTPPGDLGELVAQLEPNYLALAAVAPILDGIYTNWPNRGDGDDLQYKEVKLCEIIGESLRARLVLKKLLLNSSDDAAARDLERHFREDRKARARLLNYHHCDWTVEHCVRAGFWLMESALDLDYFDWDEDGYLIINPKYQDAIDRRREEMLRLELRHKPLTAPPPTWVSWKNYYQSVGLEATFVSDRRPETKQAIEAAFKAGDFEHARAINLLQRTPLVIDRRMLAVVEKHALELMNEKTATSDLDPADKKRQLKANRKLLRNDLATANMLGNEPFWLPYRCDWRGRLYALPHFHFARQDHVRALFKFANGLRIGGDHRALRWLHINCANAHGETDKESFEDRVAWTKENYSLIQRIAENQLDTFEEWRDTDAPFQFVAACIELVGALADPINFETRLPIGMDATSNGLQHLSLLGRDIDAGARVNLFPSDRPRDVYGDVAAIVRAKLFNKKDNKSGLAYWWDRTLRDVSDGVVRKLFKKPVMTIPYGAVRMAKQLKEAYPEFQHKCNSSTPPDGAYPYLAKHIKETAKELLSGPMAIMDYVRELADYRTKQEGFLKWTSPSAFPVNNVYREIDEEKDLIPIHLYRPIGGQVRLKAAISRTGPLMEAKARSSAGANFIHSLDASHLARVIIAASKDNIEMLANHDCFYTTAPLAESLHKRIGLKLFFMHQHDSLAYLRNQNVTGGADVLPLPPRGDIDSFIETLDSEYLTN
jgi:DNA-directed RNA polymerase